jgi:hypothetical protein
MQKLRLKVLKSLKDSTLDDAMSLLRGRTAQEPDETTRLGFLAAQTWIVRQKLLTLGTAAPVTVEARLGGLDPARDKMAKLKAAQSPDTTEIEAEQETGTTWQKVKILEETVVNGMRFFQDSVIEVTPDDAQKLIEKNKAQLFSADETPAKPKAKPRKKPAAKAKKKDQSPEKAEEGDTATAKGTEETAQNDDDTAAEKKDADT